MDELIAREFQAIRDMITAQETCRVEQLALERERGRADIVQIESRFAPVQLELENLKRPNWSALAIALSMTMGTIAGGWLIVGLKIDNTVAPLSLIVEQVRAQAAQTAERSRFIESQANVSTQANVASNTDRVQLNERVRHLETVLPVGEATTADVGNLKQEHVNLRDRLNDLREKVTVQSAALVEIETQFCNADFMRNLMHANDLRLFSLLWAKSYPGERYPTDNPYYPRIGKCGTEAIGNR